MKIKFLRQYRHPVSGNLVFVYTVSGTEAQIKAYTTAMGDKLRKADDGQPLFFTTRFAGKNGALVMTADGRAIVDSSAFDQVQSLVSQYEGALGQEIAKQAVAALIGNLGVGAGASSEVTATKIDK